MHMTHRTFTFLDILFQEAFMRTVAGHSSPKNNSRLMAPIPTLSLSMFIRHYLWNPIWFLILRLLVCLNSVGVLTWYHISSLAFKTTKKAGACRAAVYATSTDAILQCLSLFYMLVSTHQNSLPWCAQMSHNITCEWSFVYRWILKQICLQDYPRSIAYIQNPIGSQKPAIHNVYCTSLHPSWSFKPRHPLLKMFFCLLLPSNQFFNSAWQSCSSYLDMPK